MLPCNGSAGEAQDRHHAETHGASYHTPEKYWVDWVIYQPGCRNRELNFFDGSSKPDQKIAACVCDSSVTAPGEMCGVSAENQCVSLQAGSTSAENEWVFLPSSGAFAENECVSLQAGGTPAENEWVSLPSSGAFAENECVSLPSKRCVC